MTTSTRLIACSWITREDGTETQIEATCLVRPGVAPTWWQPGEAGEVEIVSIEAEDGRPVDACSLSAEEIARIEEDARDAAKDAALERNNAPVWCRRARR